MVGSAVVGSVGFKVVGSVGSAVVGLDGSAVVESVGLGLELVGSAVVGSVIYPYGYGMDKGHHPNNFFF